MESGAISDAQVTASTQFPNIYKKWHGHQGRLHRKINGNIAGGAWVASTNDANQWLQIDLGDHENGTKVTRVASQGRDGAPIAQYITMYRLQYSDDGVNFQYYREPGQNVDKVKHTKSSFIP